MWPDEKVWLDAEPWPDALLRYRKAILEAAS
jgi:hypothetical protein